MANNSNNNGLGCVWIPVVAMICWTAYKIAQLFV